MNFVCPAYAQGLSTTGLPQTSQSSLSRQRTVSSSSSTHSQHTVGSRHRGSSPLSTPGSQASSKPTPHNSRNASLTGGRADGVFQFGVPPKPSPMYTVGFTALLSQTNSYILSLLTYCLYCFGLILEYCATKIEQDTKCSLISASCCSFYDFTKILALIVIVWFCTKIIIHIFNVLT